MKQSGSFCHERKKREISFYIIFNASRGFGTRIVRADETDNFQSDKKSIETAETKILEEEFDFKEIEKSLSELFPKEKISFEEVVFSFLSGEPGEMLELLTGYIRRDSL